MNKGFSEDLSIFQEHLQYLDLRQRSRKTYKSLQHTFHYALVLEKENHITWDMERMSTVSDTPITTLKTTQLLPDQTGDT